MKVRGRGRYYAVQRKLHKSAKDGPFLHKEHTAKKENDIFLIYMEIQMGSIAKSYMKEKLNFPHIYGNSNGIGCKVIYEEGLPNIQGASSIDARFVTQI
jgi:hypothetical protein